MTTGKTGIQVPPPEHVEFDKRGRAWAKLDSLIDAQWSDDAATEHARLEREVIEAAKGELAAYEAPSSFGWTATLATACLKVRIAARALKAFEANQK